MGGSGDRGEARDGGSPVPGGRFLSLGGRVVHLIDVGEGEPVLLLHGAGGSNWSWVPVLEKLRPGLRLLAPDFPGCGLSEATEGADYSLDFYAAFVRDLLEALEVTVAHAAGNSLGAAVAVRAAGRLSESFGRLVLAAPAGLGGEPHPRLHDLLRASGEPDAAREGLRLLFHDQRLVTRGLVEETVRRRSLPGAAEALDRTLAALAPAGGARLDLREEIATLASPVLLVWGREDRVTPLAPAERFAVEHPGIRLEVFDDCGHVPQVERPGAFARLVREFLGVGAAGA